MKLIKNKRGEGDLLGEETVKVVMSVMSIAILFILAASLFFMFVNPAEMRQAEATLEEIIMTMDRLNNGERGSVVVTSPKGWYVFYSDGNIWTHDQSQVTPTDECEGNCLCICVAQDEDYVIIGGTAYGGVERGTEKYHVVDCNVKGLCKNLDDRNVKLTDFIRTGAKIDIFELKISFSDDSFELYR